MTDCCGDAHFRQSIRCTVMRCDSIRRDAAHSNPKMAHIHSGAGKCEGTASACNKMHWRQQHGNDGRQEKHRHPRVGEDPSIIATEPWVLACARMTDLLRLNCARKTDLAVTRVREDDELPAERRSAIALRSRDAARCVVRVPAQRPGTRQQRRAALRTALLAPPLRAPHRPPPLSVEYTIGIDQELDWQSMWVAV